MAKENFLINPPKRKPSSKHVKHTTLRIKRAKESRKKHRIIAFEAPSGGLFTSSKAKIVRKGIKLNPFRRFRSNPLGEELMFVGLNPFMKGGKTMAKKRRRYHGNPMSDVKSMIPMVISGGVGALLGRSVPQFIPVLKNMGTLGNLISKVALAVGGAMLIDKTGLGNKFKGSEDGWMIGSLSSAAADLSSVGIVKTMQGLGMIEPDMITDYPANGMGMYLEGTDDDPYADTNGTYQETY